MGLALLLRVWCDKPLLMDSVGAMGKREGHCALPLPPQGGPPTPPRKPMLNRRSTLRLTASPTTASQAALVATCSPRTQSRSFTDSFNTAVRRVALLLEVPSRGTEIFVSAFGSHRAAEGSGGGSQTVPPFFSRHMAYDAASGTFAPLISGRSEAEDMLGAMGFEALCNLSFTDVTASSADAPVAFVPCVSLHRGESAEKQNGLCLSVESIFILRNRK